MKVIAIILARGGSKGLPRKNLRSLDGETLIERAIRHARSAEYVGTVLVSTDDPEIASVASHAGAVVPFLRPQNLAGDLSTTEEALQHALLTYEECSGNVFDTVVFLTTTDIFRESRWIDEAVERLRRFPALESVFVGHRTHKNFWEQKEDGTWVRLRDWMSVYASRQIRRTIVREDTGLTCATRAHLVRQGRRTGDRVEIIVNDDDFTGIDIHHEEDLALAEAALEIRKLKRNPEQ